MQTKKKRIGILGGTFNPIHLGHMIIAQNAAEELSLDKVLLMPAGISYFKDQNKIVSKEHRNNMVSLIAKDNCVFELSTIETEREGNSYTYETILELQNPEIELYYIIGADTLFSMEKWRNPEIIFKYSTIVCSKRDNISNMELENKKAFLEKNYNANIIILDTPEVAISSTHIREMLANGRSCKYYLHEEVVKYIQTNKLYK